MKTLIVGLGNPILGDGGAGWKVAEDVKQQLPLDALVDVICLSLGGLSLMECLIGYQRAILIDAFPLDEPLGSILILKLRDLPNYSGFHTASGHDTSLKDAIELGRSLGAHLPTEVEIVGIATGHIDDFGRELSLPVAEAIPFAARVVVDLLKQEQN